MYHLLVLVIRQHNGDDALQDLTLEVTVHHYLKQWISLILCMRS